MLIRFFRTSKRRNSFNLRKRLSCRRSASCGVCIRMVLHTYHMVPTIYGWFGDFIVKWDCNSGRRINFVCFHLVVHYCFYFCCFLFCWWKVFGMMKRSKWESKKCGIRFIIFKTLLRHFYCFWVLFTSPYYHYSCF